MRFVVVTFLCFIFWCGNVHAQSVADSVSTKYTPWSVSAFSLISQEGGMASQGGLLNSYNFVGPNYRISPTERLALRGAFSANTTGYDSFNGECVVDQDASLENPFVEYNNYSLGWLPGIADIFWSGRVYIPVSKSSRRKKTIAQYRSSTIFTRFFTQRIFGELRNDFQYYQQSSTTYFGTQTNENCGIEDNTGPSNTRQYRMRNWLSLWYRATFRWSFGVQYQLQNQRYNQSDSNSTSRQRNGRMNEISMAIGPTIRYTANNNLSFILSFRDVVEYSGFHPERQDDLVELGEFRSRNTEVALLSFIRF